MINLEAAEKVLEEAEKAYQSSLGKKATENHFC